MAYPKYNKNNTKNICDMDTTPPMKKPTAMELWNFRIIIVPPMLRMHNIPSDQKLANPSENGRVPMTAKDNTINNTVSPRMEYLMVDQIKVKSGGPAECG